MHVAPLALTIDLDDTLWPVWPAIENAERVLHDWLRAHAPATAQRFDTAGLRALREQVALERPQHAHDFSTMRRESIRRALRLAGEDDSLAAPAFDAFFVARQQVALFDDVLPALRRLAARRPLFALSNGNADLTHIGLATWFRGGLSAHEFGCGKPEPGIFHEACRRLGLPPAQVMHVGDDLATDVQGALDAGLQAVWLVRDGRPAQAPPCPVVPHLLALADTLGC